MELHREGSAPAACAAGLFIIHGENILNPLEFLQLRLHFTLYHYFCHDIDTVLIIYLLPIDDKLFALEGLGHMKIGHIYIQNRYIFTNYFG